MSLINIIRHFEAIGHVPVELPDVLTELRKLNHERVITHGIDGGGKALRGVHVRQRKKAMAGSALMDEAIVRIIYSTQLDIKWQRVVCCKELVHAFDPPPMLTNSKEDVVRLCEDMARKNGDFDESNHIKTTFDLVCTWKAMTILFPFAMYTKFLPLLRERRVTIEQISDMTQIPERYVRTIMTDQWATVREQLIG